MTTEAPIIGLTGLPELLASDSMNVAGQSDEDLGREHLSHSAVTAALSCQQLYDFRYEQELTTVLKPKPLLLGSAFQLAIEANNPNAGIDHVVTETTQHVRSQEDEDAMRIDSVTVGAAAEAYLRKWGSPEGAIREFEYRVRLRNPWSGAYSRTFDLLGFADEVLLEDEGPLLIENKLVGRVDETVIRRLPLDRQIAIACYGLYRATGQPVERVRYRFTRKPSIRQKQGETVEQFCDRLIADYRNPEREDFYMHEEPLERDASDLVRTEAELWEWAEDVRRHRRRRIWPRNTSHCHEYGGCPFIPLCVGDPDALSLYRRKDPTS